MTVDSYPHRAPREKIYLGVLLLSGPVIWSVYFLAGYSLVEASCSSSFLAGEIGGLPTVSIVVTVLTLLALGLSAFAGWRAYQHWRSWKTPDEDLFLGDPPFAAFEGKPDETFDLRESQAFMMLSALILSALFSLTILITGIPVLLLDPCGAITP